MSPLAQQLFIILADGKIHRGEKLADHFKVTRQGIWKAINELKNQELVNTIGRSGYRAKFRYDVLDQQKILSLLDPKFHQQLDSITIHFETESTNNDAISMPVNNALVVLSEMQTQAKGRRERSWHAPLVANLYCSMKLRFQKQTLSNLTSFSPALGAYIAKMLNDLDIPAKVKWPNDIWVKGAKLAGILIEIQAKSESEIEMTIGIGINNHKIARDHIDQKVMDCETILGAPLDRNLLTAHLIKIILTLHNAYEENRIPKIEELWKRQSALIGQKVRLFSPFKEIVGTEIGIGENGALMIRDDTGKIGNYFSGELSLRPYG